MLSSRLFQSAFVRGGEKMEREKKKMKKKEAVSEDGRLGGLDWRGEKI